MVHDPVVGGSDDAQDGSPSEGGSGGHAAPPTDFGIERIYAPDSVDGSEGLLAIVVHAWCKNETKFVTDSAEPIQVAIIAMGERAIVDPHTHLPQQRIIVGTQEVLILREGRLRISVFASSGELAKSVVLTEGDMIVLLRGGHSVFALEASEFIEVKQGPYYGKDADKRAL